MMTREEHLAMAKTRARECMDLKLFHQAVSSMISDMNKDWSGSPPMTMVYVKAGMQLLIQQPQVEADIRTWIEAAR